MNGVYDLLCALSILHIINCPFLCKLHLNLINNKKTETNSRMFERMLAYWILTYGIIRVSDHYLLAACSYYIEAIGYILEFMHKTVHPHKTMFVIYSCIILGGISNYVYMYHQ